MLWSDVLGRLFCGVDITCYGEDGNPGAINALKACGWKLGVPAAVLDVMKGFLPVYYFALQKDLGPAALTAVMVAPIMGHIFSPLRRFRGGKGIATTFGVWAGMSAGVLAFVLAAFLALLELGKWALHLPKGSRTDAVGTVLGFAIFTLYLYVALPYLTMPALVNWALLVYSHRKELAAAWALRY